MKTEQIKERLKEIIKELIMKAIDDFFFIMELTTDYLNGTITILFPYLLILNILLLLTGILSFEKHAMLTVGIILFYLVFSSDGKRIRKTIY